MAAQVPTHEVEAQRRVQTAEPPMFKVLMHNDDYSTMEFVVEVLLSVFHKSAQEAEHIMLTIHHKGFGLCGIYPFAVAETKVLRVHALAQSHGYPLRCSLEQA